MWNTLPLQVWWSSDNTRPGRHLHVYLTELLVKSKAWQPAATRTASSLMQPSLLAMHSFVCTKVRNRSIIDIGIHIIVYQPLVLKFWSHIQVQTEKLVLRGIIWLRGVAGQVHILASVWQTWPTWIGGIYLLQLETVILIQTIVQLYITYISNGNTVTALLCDVGISV